MTLAGLSCPRNKPQTHNVMTQPMPPHYSDDEMTAILSSARSFAIVGASANTNRPSYFVQKYLLAKGYSVNPVNPGIAGTELLGQRVFATLEEIKTPVDVVDIFRNSDAALEITRAALRLKDALQIKVIWMQLGVINAQAEQEAQAAGLRVIMNRCPKIEYGRLSGEIGWAGVNSGSLSSKRPHLSPTGVQDHRLKA